MTEPVDAVFSYGEWSECKTVLEFWTDAQGNVVTVNGMSFEEWKQFQQELRDAYDS
jgi:hypothetical protein